MNAQPRPPRFEADAGKYTDDEALERFVPSIVWDQVRRPTHQVLYGGTGTGKTMLLRRLSWPAMLREPNFLDDQDFIAFYVDMREMEDLSLLYSHSGSVDPHVAERLSIYLGTVHLLHAIIDTMLRVEELVSFELHQKILGAILSTANTVLSKGGKSFASLLELNDYLEEAKGTFVSSVSNPRTLLAELGDSAAIAAPEQALRLFAMRVRRISSDLRIGILLDQYEMLPIQCQRLFNPLLKRENANAFFTIVASRPFSFNAEYLNGYVRPIEDFELTVVEYILPDDSSQYDGLLSNIWSKIRPGYAQLETLLEGGVDYFATLSSRSIRRFLELCRVSGTLQTSPPIQISLAEQQTAATVISRAFRDEVKFTPGIAQGVIWDLVLMIAKTSPVDRQVSSTGLPAEVHLRSTDLFGTETFTQPVVTVLTKAFEEGALQFLSREDGSSFTVPERFCVAPIVAPILRRDLNFLGKAFIDGSEIERLTKLQPMRKPARGTAPTELRQVFLSISFEDLPEPTIVRELFADSFSEHGIRVIEGRAVGPGLIAQLFEQIKTTDITILDISSLRPNIVVELGLTLGMSHRVIPVRNSVIPISPEVERYSFLSDMGWLNYSLRKDSLSKLRDDVIRWSRAPVSEAHLLQKTLNGAIPLRVQQQARTVALYYPSERRDVWEHMLPLIRRIASDVDCELLVVDERPHAKSLDVFDNLVWCLSKADRIIIDTSAPGAPDLNGAFALGFAFALSNPSRKQILRLEQRNLSHPKGIGMWPQQHYQIWENPKKLLETIRHFLPYPRRSRGRRS